MAKAKAKKSRKARKSTLKRKKPVRKVVKKVLTAARKVLKKPSPRPKPKAMPPAPPPPPGERIGVVTHYYGHLAVAVVKLEPNTLLRVGDNIHIKGHTSDFAQRVESLQVGHSPVNEVGPDDDFGLKVVEHAREHDVVYRVK